MDFHIHHWVNGPLLNVQFGSINLLNLDGSGSETLICFMFSCPADNWPMLAPSDKLESLVINLPRFIFEPYNS